MPRTKTCPTPVNQAKKTPRRKELNDDDMKVFGALILLKTFSTPSTVSTNTGLPIETVRESLDVLHLRKMVARSFSEVIDGVKKPVAYLAVTE